MSTQNYADKCEIEKLQAQIDVMRETLEFYAAGYLMDEELADDDCEQDKQMPWRFLSGKRAREAIATIDKLLKEIK